MQILDLEDDIEMRKQQLEAYEKKYDELSDKF